MKKMIFFLVLGVSSINGCAQTDSIDFTIKSEKTKRPHPQIEEFTSTFLLEYPIFKGGDAANLINKDISSFIDSIGCLESGERQIIVEVRKKPMHF